MANLGISGNVRLPVEQEPCLAVLDRVESRLKKALARFHELAGSRMDDERVQGQLVEILERWFVLGREPIAPDTPPFSQEGVEDKIEDAGQ
jgi:hypothetical protein